MEDSAAQASFLGEQGFFTKELGIDKEGAYDAAVAEVYTGPTLDPPLAFFPPTVGFSLQLDDFFLILPIFLPCVASERRVNIVKGFKDVDLEAMARIWL